jgi:hypothetical protein
LLTPTFRICSLNVSGVVSNSFSVAINAAVTTQFFCYVKGLGLTGTTHWLALESNVVCMPLWISGIINPVAAFGSAYHEILNGALLRFGQRRNFTWFHYLHWRKPSDQGALNPGVLCVLQPSASKSPNSSNSAKPANILARLWAYRQNDRSVRLNLCQPAVPVK